MRERSLAARLLLLFWVSHLVLIPHLFVFLTGEIIPERDFVRCHAGMATLLCRHGNVVTAAWQRCYGGMATLLRRRGNVVTAAWQRARRHVDTGTAYYVMDLWVIKTAKVNGKQQVFHLCSMCVVFVQVLCRNACTPFLINSAIFIKKNPLFSGNVVYEKSGVGVVKSGR